MYEIVWLVFYTRTFSGVLISCPPLIGKIHHRVQKTHIRFIFLIREVAEGPFKISSPQH